MLQIKIHAPCNNNNISVSLDFLPAHFIILFRMLHSYLPHSLNYSATFSGTARKCLKEKEKKRKTRLPSDSASMRLFLQPFSPIFFCIMLWWHISSFFFTHFTYENVVKFLIVCNFKVALRQIK